MAFFINLSSKLTGQYSRTLLCAARHYGTSPEMPLVGSKGWNLMLKSLEAQQSKPPLSKADVLNAQRLTYIETEMATIKDMMAKVVQTNESLKHSVDTLSSKIFTR